MQGAQFQTPPMTKVNKIIIITMVAFFVLNTILTQAAGMSLIPLLSLSVGGVKSGLVYQFITYPFIESGLMGVIFEGLLIWFIGSELEQKWGQKFYIKFLLVAVLTSGPFYFLIGSIFPAMGAHPLMGLTSFTYALLMAYAIIYSERQLTFMLLFPMKAKYFCMLLAAIQLYMGLTSGSGASSLSHLVAMASAFVFLRYMSMKARGVSLDSIKRQRHKEKMKSKLSIVKDVPKDKADPQDPKYWQ